MGELFDKEVNAQKESLKKLQGFPRKPTKKCAMKMKETNKEIRKKRRARKNVIDGRKHYIGRLQKTGETSFGSTIMDTMQVPFV